MSALGSTLSIARGAIFAQQNALQVTSQNIANADVPGYSRQRATLTAGAPLVMPNGVFGTGVFVTDVQRVRDSLLDATYRRQSGAAEGSAMRQDLLQQVESVFNEPADAAIASTMDRFWGAWSDLANNPTSAPAKSMVVQRGQQLAQAFNAADTGLTRVAGDAKSRLGADVGQVNALAKQIADLNVSIVSSEVGGHQAGDLRDQRDLRIDALSKLAGTNVIERQDGSVGVYLGTTTLVDGSSAKQLEVRGPTTATLTDPSGAPFDAPHYDVGIVGSNTLLGDAPGTIGAALTVLNADVPQARQSLDRLARGVGTTVNAAYRRGYSAAYEASSPAQADWTNADPALRGSNGVLFAYPSGTLTAANIFVTATADTVPAGYTRYATNDNSLALDIAAMRTTAGQIGTQSFADFYNGAVSTVAANTADAGSAADAAGALATQSDTRRQSISGVSTDEELIQLTKHQQAYAAAAKLVKTVDEMLQTLLGIV